MNRKDFKKRVVEAKKQLERVLEYGPSQSEFNSMLANRENSYRSTAISQREKNNLYADIKDFEQEFKDLQRTASELPDDYMARVCDTQSYPFDEVIDDVADVEDWCHEAEAFLKSDIDSWGIMDKAQKYY